MIFSLKRSYSYLTSPNLLMILGVSSEIILDTLNVRFNLMHPPEVPLLYESTSTIKVPKRIQLLLSIHQLLIFSCPYDNFSGGLYQKLCQDQRRRNKDFLFI